MHIEHHISKGQIEVHVFGQVNVAANQSAVALPVAGVSGGVTSKGLVWPGSLVGFSYTLSAAGTAGVFTIVPTINGTAISTAYQATVGTTTKGRVKIPRNKVPLLETDVVGVKITTDGSWDGTTSDLAVTLRVLAELDGI